MSLQVNVRLKLCKQKKVICVKYNTFEKATYDEYLISSLALRAKNKTEAYKYIDDITGQGSLNKYFKDMYEEISQLSVEQLNSVINNSMFPVLKIDKSNSYKYYPELNISMFKGKIFDGDLAEYEDIERLVMIKEKIIETNIEEREIKQFKDSYRVKFDKDIKINLEDNWVTINKDLFYEILVNELDNLNKYEGKILNTADGQGWSILTNSVINNMFADDKYYYDNGCYKRIRDNDVKITHVANLSGLYIYKEEFVPFNNNTLLCEKVLSELFYKDLINNYKTKSLINLLNNAKEKTAQAVINYISENKSSKEVSMLGIDILKKGVEKGWNKSSLLDFIKFGQISDITYIYKVDPNLEYNLEQILSINYSELTEKDRKRVDKYKISRQKKIDRYITLVGTVASSALRENVKQLKASNTTKRFTKLTIDHLGHTKKDITTVSDTQLDQSLKEAEEMYSLMEKLQKELDKIEDKK